MKSKLLMIAIIVVIMFEVLSCDDKPGYYVEFRYTVFNGEITITGISEYRQGFNYLNIPAQINGKPVTSIMPGAFRYSLDNDFTNINVDAANTAYSSQDGVLYNKNKTTLHTCPYGKTGTFIIPDSVTRIGASAFAYCRSLTSVTIPNSVTSIEHEAFSQCGLTNITIPDSVTSIEYSAFYDCKNIEITWYYSSALTYYDDAGSGNPYLINYFKYYLKTVIIPNSVTSIENGAFKDCHNLTSVTIGSSVNTIGASAFEACYQLTNITIPDSVTSIEYSAFFSCTSLTSVTFQGTISSNNLIYSVFPGDLKEKYLAGGIGTYMRPNTSSNTWTKML